jgi:hypothetical protein
MEHQRMGTIEDLERLIQGLPLDMPPDMRARLVAHLEARVRGDDTHVFASRDAAERQACDRYLKLLEESL